MMKLFLETMWLILPAASANMAPIFAAKLFPLFNRPIDCGRLWRGKRIFGDHKTIRGLVSGVVLSGVVFYCQSGLETRIPSIASYVDSGQIDIPVWFGFWQGFWALSADAVKSFFKRRVGIQPGRAWIPFDQIDWAVGALFGSIPFAEMRISHVVVALMLALVLSPAMHALGYLLGLNSEVT